MYRSVTERRRARKDSAALGVKLSPVKREKFGYRELSKFQLKPKVRIFSVHIQIHFSSFKHSCIKFNLKLLKKRIHQDETMIQPISLSQTEVPCSTNKLSTFSKANFLSMFNHLEIYIFDSCTLQSFYSTI